MDFGDILDQWENYEKNQARKQKESGKNQVSRKKANAPTKEEKELEKARKEAREGYDFLKEREKKINPTELWLRRYGTLDKDAMEEESREREKFQSRSYISRMKCDSRIDLHGLTRDEAWTRLDAFVGDCESRGFKKIMIVHGKGIHTKGTDPVLGEMVRKFIEVDKRLGTSGHPESSQGGKGSTWVILKKNI